MRLIFSVFGLFSITKNDQYTGVFQKTKVNNLFTTIILASFLLIFSIKNTLYQPHFLNLLTFFSNKNSIYQCVQKTKINNFSKTLRRILFLIIFFDPKYTTISASFSQFFDFFFKKMTDILLYFRKQKYTIFHRYNEYVFYFFSIKNTLLCPPHFSVFGLFKKK